MLHYRGDLKTSLFPANGSLLASFTVSYSASDATTYVGAAGKVFNNVRHRILAYVCTVTGEKERAASILSHLWNQRSFGLAGIPAANYCATVANPLRSISAKGVSSISDP
jgi:hypothetical protein